MIASGHEILTFWDQLLVMRRGGVTDQEASSTPKRLWILGDEEIEALYGRPCFTADDRAHYFTLTQPEKESIQLFLGAHSQLSFLLQLGYFKAKQLFFAFTLD